MSFTVINPATATPVRDDEEDVAVLQRLEVDDRDPAAVVLAADLVGVPAGDQHPTPVDDLVVTRVGRGGDAPVPPPLGALVGAVPAEAPLDSQAGDARSRRPSAEVGQDVAEPDPAAKA